MQIGYEITGMDVTLVLRTERQGVSKCDSDERDLRGILSEHFKRTRMTDVGKDTCVKVRRFKGFRRTNERVLYEGAHYLKYAGPKNRAGDPWLDATDNLAAVQKYCEERDIPVTEGIDERVLEVFDKYAKDNSL